MRWLLRYSSSCRADETRALIPRGFLSDSEMLPPNGPPSLVQAARLPDLWPQSTCSLSHLLGTAQGTCYLCSFNLSCASLQLDFRRGVVLGFSQTFDILSNHWDSQSPSLLTTHQHPSWVNFDLRDVSHIRSALPIPFGSTIPDQGWHIGVVSPTKNGYFCFWFLSMFVPPWRNCQSEFTKALLCCDTTLEPSVSIDLNKQISMT